MLVSHQETFVRNTLHTSLCVFLNNVIIYHEQKALGPTLQWQRRQSLL